MRPSANLSASIPAFVGKRFTTPTNLPVAALSGRGPTQRPALLFMSPPPPQTPHSSAFGASARPAPAGKTMAMVGLVLGYSVAAYLFFGRGHVVAPAIILTLSTGVALCAVFAPAAYQVLHGFFLRVGHKVGLVLSYLLLVPLFYLFFVPARLLRALTGSDPLRLSAKAARDTYWTPRPVDADPERYRKQY